MNCNRIYIWILLLAISSIASCQDSKNKIYTEVIKEWMGREMQFPDSMITTDGDILPPPSANFTIVSYYDSTGCTGCRMQLPFWNEFMRKVDSITGDNSVELLMICATDNLRELDRLLTTNHLSGRVVYDPEDKLNSLNRFPDREELQSFLLDYDRKVVALGNPIYNKSIARLYISKIIDKEQSEDSPLDKEDVYEFDLGRINVGEKVEHIFKLHNNYEGTLKVRDVITSCECTLGKVNPIIIPAGSDYELEIEFSDTITGEFYRTISIIFENNQPDIQFEVSGEIINPIY